MSSVEFAQRLQKVKAQNKIVAEDILFLAHLSYAQDEL